MTDFQIDEVVDITIMGARVNATRHEPLAALSYEVNGVTSSVPLIEGVTVERVAPAEWPPQPGDVWRDRFGDLWFGLGRCVDGDDFVTLQCAIEKADPWGYDTDIVREYGPLVLERREIAKPCSCGHHGDHAGCDADCECAS